MSDQPEVQAGPVVKVARDLTAIEEHYEALLVQAIHQSNSALMPGGEAMVARAGAGSPDEWAELMASAEFQHIAACPRADHTRCRFAEHIADEDDQEPPLQTLLFWSEQWRAEAGYSLDRRPTIATEANFIRGALNKAWDELVEWDDFAKDIRKARARVENLLMLGQRAERGAPCLYEGCRGVRLVRKLVPYRGKEGGKSWQHSDWHCPTCKRSWDQKRYASMVTAGWWATQREEINGQTWCSVKYASVQSGVPETTIRAWISQTGKQERPVDREHPIALACLAPGRRIGFVCLDDVVARRERAKRKGAA